MAGDHSELTRSAGGEILHFSEDPSIAVFEPHLAGTARHGDAYVSAVVQYVVLYAYRFSAS